MNKRRLLLFSVFALLHITTSERNFIDGRCCNHLSRFLVSDTSSSTYETHRVQRFLPEIRQLNNHEKYPNPNERDTEITQLSRRRQIGYIKQRSRDNEVREIVERQRQNILTNPTEEIRGRQNFRERIHEFNNALRNDIRHNRFASLRDRESQRNIRNPSLSRNDNRINDGNRNRFQDRNVIRNNYNERDTIIHNTRDIRNEVRRNLPELVEHNTERYANRNNMRNDFDYGKKSTESYIFPQESIYERTVRLERNTRAIRSDRAIVINRLVNDRISILGRYRNLDEDLSQTDSSRQTFVRNNVRSNNIMNLKDNKRRSVSDKINRRTVRDADNLNSMIESRARSENVRNRVVNELRTRTRNYKLELRETSRLQKDYADNRYERTTRTQSDHRLNVDRFDVNRKRDKRVSIRRGSSEEMDASRDRRNDARVQFARGNLNYNVRYNRDTNEREISQERERRVNVSPDKNHKNIKSIEYMERNTLKNTQESRLRDKNRRSVGKDDRDTNKNRLSNRRSHVERALEKDNERTTNRNLPTEEFRVKDVLRRTERIQRRINDASDKMVRRNSDAVRYSPEIRQRDDSRRNLRESRYVRPSETHIIIERGDRRQTDNRPETNNDRIRNNNVEQKFKNQFRLTVRQDQNRITSRIHRTIMTVRSGNQISTENTGKLFHQRSRSLSNDKRLTGNRQDIRNTDDERRQTRITQERRINTRRMTTVVNERRDSMIEFSNDRRSMMTYKIQYENHVFEMKWQYLFYTLQLVYLCSILVNIPKENEGNKHRRFADWFTPAKFLKID